MDPKFIQDIQENFCVRTIKSIKPITTGNINSTYRVEADGENYILQKINSDIFDGLVVMDNVIGVSEHIENKLSIEGGDTKREVLKPVDTLDQTKVLKDKNHEYWRMFYWIEGAKTYDNIEDAENNDNINGEKLLYQCGKGLGKFYKSLSDYPTDKLQETIPDFHNTVKRYTDFDLAVKADKVGILKEIGDDKSHSLIVAIEKIRQYEEQINLLELGKRSGKLPVRVTHNDPKINNIMIDVKTKEVLCMIDLDTVGEGLSAYDFGDAIRSAANRAGEEPENIEDAVIDLKLFKAFTEGYLKQTLVVKENGKINNDPRIGLTKEEVAVLHKAPIIITLEQAMRFLGDYINGNEYFKIKEGQPDDINLTRALTQLHLVEDMMQKEQEMQSIVNSLVKGIVQDASTKSTSEIKIEDNPR